MPIAAFCISAPESAVLQEIGNTRAAATDDLAAKLTTGHQPRPHSGQEYVIGVKDGRIADPHEDHDASGFVQAAKAQMANLEEQRPGLQIGQDIRETLEADLRAERSARELYAEARDKCHEHRDYVTMKLFEDLLKDEEGHIDWLETQLDLLDRIGVQLYGQLQAGHAGEGDS